jgi:hypothetical protein
VQDQETAGLLIHEFDMKDDGLLYFWIDHNDMHGPLGYGVTAFSEQDAFQLVEGLGYQIYAADKIRQINTVEELACSVGQRAVRASISEASIQSRPAFGCPSRWPVSLGRFRCWWCGRVVRFGHLSSRWQRVSCRGLLFRRQALK